MFTIPNFCLACECGNLNSIKYMLEKGGADIEETNSYNRTGIFLAIIRNDLSIIKYLIEQGANIEAVDRNGDTPLILASWRGHYNIVKYLIDNGANIEAKDKNGDTSLWWATIRNTNPNIVKYLLEQGAYFRYIRIYANYFHHNTEHKTHKDLISLLRKYQIDFNTNIYGVDLYIEYYTQLKKIFEKKLLDIGGEKEITNIIIKYI